MNKSDLHWMKEINTMHRNFPPVGRLHRSFCPFGNNGKRSTKKKKKELHKNRWRFNLKSIIFFTVRQIGHKYIERKKNNGWHFEQKVTLNMQSRILFFFYVEKWTFYYNATTIHKCFTYSITRFGMFLL